jgi:hypothetical protein
MNSRTAGFVSANRPISQARRIHCRSLLLLAALAWLPTASGQTWSAGVTAGGLPFNDFGKGATGYTTTPSRLLIGPTLRLRLSSGVGFEAGALRKSVTFDYIFGVNISYSEYHMQSAAWQFPLLFHYGRSAGPVTPYFNAGMSLRRITGVNQKGQNCTQLPTVVCTPFERTEAPELDNATSGGVVIGGGLEFGVSFLRLSPEVRFTRWLSRPFSAPLASENQVEVLVRIAVPIAGSRGR